MADHAVPSAAQLRTSRTATCKKRVSHSGNRHSYPLESDNVRRLLGIMIGICALYLTVGAVDAPCSDHFLGSASESSAAVIPHDDGSHHELPEQQGDQPGPCTSAALQCCVAMTSCVTTIALGESAPSTSVSIAAQIAPSVRIAHPLSRIAAPEPPPPKA